MSTQPKTLVERLDELEKQLVAIKTTQPVGTSSVRTFEMLSNNVWDIERTSFNYQGTGRYAESIQVEFQAKEQKAPFVSLSAIASIDNVIYNPLNRPAAPNPLNNEYINIQEDFIAGGRENLSIENGTGRVRFLVQLSTPTIGRVFRLKFRVRSTDRGVFRWKFLDDDGWNTA